MPVRSPLGLARLWMDLSWATGEYASKVALDPFLRRLAPRAEKPRAVLTLPGFGGPEISMNPLNAFLARQGYLAEGWGLGTNRGPQSDDALSDLVTRLKPKLERLAETTGEKVALVGQSLGGIYARELARALPDLTDRVITLGSPAYLKADDGIAHMNRVLPVAMRWMTGKAPEAHLSAQETEAVHAAPPVPLVAIYSALDGVVDETVTAIPKGDISFQAGLPRENIQVLGSHCGMAVSPICLIAICDRLRADPADWKAFDAAPYFPLGSRFARRLLYPISERMTRAA